MTVPNRVEVDGVEVVVAHAERATLRVGDVFVKVDGDPRHHEIEVAAMAAAPVPTPEVRWHRPPALALGALPGRALGRLEEPSAASPAAWRAAGAAVRRLHDSQLPSWSGTTLDARRARLDSECDALLAGGVLPTDVVERNRRLADRALVPRPEVFAHGDLQLTHVFVDGDEVTGIIDWSEAGRGDPLFDLATLTLAHEEHLDDVLAGYGGDVDRDDIRAWWAWRCLVVVRWLTDHGFGAVDDLPEVAVLRRLP